MKDDALEYLDLVDRIHRACLTVASFPASGPRSFFSTWPAYKLEWYDFEEFGAARMPEAVVKRLIAPPRFTPTAKEIDDALPALGLLDGGVNALQRRIVRLRASQNWYGRHVAPDDDDLAHWRGGWRAIGRMVARSHKQARLLHDRAMLFAYGRFLDQTRNRVA